MDAIVQAALKKWPNVPACRGWLALDARGDWYMRDDRVQAAGHFPAVKGSRIEHEKLRDFIERNYAAETEGPWAGSWFFQNGPQKVYVELEAAPWVWRVLDADGALASHHGQPAVHRSAWLDEDGRLFVHADTGFGLVHTQDMHLAALAVEAGLWQPKTMAFETLPARFGFVLSPQRAFEARRLDGA